MQHFHFSAPVGREVYKKFSSTREATGPELLAPSIRFEYPSWWKTQPRVPILSRTSTLPLPIRLPSLEKEERSSSSSNVVPDVIPTQATFSEDPPPAETKPRIFPRIFKHKPKRATHYPTDFEFDLFYEPPIMSTTTAATTTTTTTTTTAGGSTASGSTSTALTYSTIYVPPFASSGATFDGSGNASDFLHRYSLLAISYGWDDDTKTRNFSHHLTDYPAAWYRIYADTQEEKKVTITWAELEKAFRTVFSSKDTPESLHRQIRQVKFRGNTQQYLYALLPLLRKLDPKMSDDKLVRYLIKGCPERLAELITMTNPTTFEKVEQLLLQSEKFHSMYPGNKNQDDEDDSLSRAMRRLDTRSRRDEGSLVKKSAQFHQVEMEQPEVPVHPTPKPQKRGHGKRSSRNAPINIIFTERGPERGSTGYGTRGRGRDRSNVFNPQQNIRRDPTPRRAHSPSYQSSESPNSIVVRHPGGRDSPSRNNGPSLKSIFDRARNFRRSDGQGPCFECLDFGQFARDCPIFRQRLIRARDLAEQMPEN